MGPSWSFWGKVRARPPIQYESRNIEPAEVVNNLLKVGPGMDRTIMRLDGYYDREWSGREGQRHERFDAIMEMLTPDSRVLDIGCGDGVLCSLLDGELGCAVCGADFSKVALERVKERGFPVVQVDIEKPLPFVDDSFDHVVCSEVLEHLFDPRAALKEMVRVASRSVVVTVPNVGFILDRLRLLIKGRFPVTDPGHIRFWTRTDFIEMVDKLGFRVERVTGTHFRPRFVHHPATLFATVLCYEVSKRDTGR
jgi:methionine biosynthesis protein MetW